MPRYIDADKLIPIYEEMIRSGDYCKDCMKDAIFEIEQAPTITPDEVRGVGEWLPDVGEFGFPEIPCSVCGYKSGHYGFNYCPNCGARMKGAEDGTTDNP